MKVLHLVSGFDQGGSERQALQLVRLLRQSNRYQIYLASLRAEGSLRRIADELVDRIHVYALTGFYDMNALIQLRRFASLLRTEQISIVQAHDFYSNVFGMAGAALGGVPVRIAARRETGGVRTGAQKVAERWAYRLAHVVVANADAVGQQLIREGMPAARVYTVHNGLNVERIKLTGDRSRASLAASLGLSPNPSVKYITIVANMRFRVKDHETFLKAAALVASAEPHAEFLLAGEGELQPSIRARATELGIVARTHFLGRCDHMPELLALSDICVLSSRAEGFPNAVLEYMAAGRPVVATDVGGIREAVSEGKSGYLVAPGDADQMADRILRLLKDPAQAEAMGKLGRTIVEQRFSCEAQLANTEALYDRLLAPHTDAPRLKVAEEQQALAAKINSQGRQL
jgi:glycosyltransferase involved in cell wall biosynthesis